MARVKRGTTSLRHRKSILRETKGYRFGLNKKERQANEAIMHAGKHAFAHRRDKKNDFRRVWNIRLNAALRGLPTPLSYSTFIALLKKKKIELNRKMLSQIAKEHPLTFERVVKEVSP